MRLPSWRELLPREVVDQIELHVVIARKPNPRLVRLSIHREPQTSRSQPRAHYSFMAMSQSGNIQDGSGLVDGKVLL